MDKRGRAMAAERYLGSLYPDADCSLEYSDPWRLLVAVRLSAQCTDKRVNMVTPALFERYPDAEAMSRAEVGELESLIHPCGFFRSKARDLIAMSGRIAGEYGGKVPDTMEELLSLPGVGRKSANLILGDVYGKPAIVCDTHMIRISNRLGLADSTDPVKVESQLRGLLTPETSAAFCHRVVDFGRDVCRARNPRCESCGLSDICVFFKENSPESLT
ncbi:MAG: endonuclease III [Clostridia bacterium]|nr:endonuclease III [Clostridia bacterium]